MCSGIEAASVAWHPLGWRAAWVAEIEPFPSSVLAHHYPDVPNLGDMTTLPAQVLLGIIEAPDVLVGGTPCQAFSVAGLRNSLADDRGNLTLSYFHLLDAIDHARAERNEPACVAVWENVPGVLSTKDNAFGCFLAGLAGESDAIEPPGGKWSDAGCVVGPERTIAWRVLDAQYFGLAQRRRRVFVVASARDDIDPAAILFEFEGVRRDSAPSREAREETAGTLDARTNGGGFPGTDGACAGHVQPVGWPAQVACTLNTAYGDKMGLEDQHALGGASLFVPAVMGTITARMFNALGARDVEEGAVLAVDCLNQTVTGDVSKTLAARNDQDTASVIALPATMPTLRAGAPNGGAGAVARSGDSQDEYIIPVAHSLRGEGFDASEDGTSGVPRPVPVSIALRGREGGATAEVGDECAFALRASSGGGDKPHVLAMQVRRLTPRECERLQGFPDDYTLVPHRNKPAADGPRYKALGNSMAVPCMRWIGERIAVSLI